jgi:DNA polymerase-3 subunit gamma/tau
MAYTVLARRYRSRSFDEVVGQETIARTLANAIERDRVGHAYLFTGTRGVGKTSMARIFAKALNAPNDEPADVADAIMQGRDTDVIEIDAASNRGVDEARELIANSVYRPMRGRYKVYIIDEVHMLTREAFNALLKTMEEPPSHVKFILCTTEAHKVPPTIQSRCQRFDFKNIDTRRIADHLREVLKGEKVNAEPAVVTQIARLGNGSMRDALTLMDRLLATGEKKLTASLLQDILGLPQQDVVDAVLDSCARGGVKGALEAADQLLRSGVTIDQAFESIETRLRDLLILSACGADSEIVELDGEDRARAAALAAQFDASSITYMIALCENASRSAKSSSTPRALFDAIVARMAMAERVADALAVSRGAPASAKPVAGPPPKKAQAPAGGDPARSATPVIAVPPALELAVPCADTSDLWMTLRESAPPGVKSILRVLTLKEQSPDALILEASDADTLTMARTALTRIQEAASNLAGRAIEVKLLASARVAAASAPAAPGGASHAPARQHGMTVAEREALEHPLVRTAVDLFGARIVRVETDDRSDDVPEDPAAKEE